MMTTAIMNYTLIPLSGVFNGINSFFISLSKARTAAELYRMGYSEEAKNLLLT